MSNEITFEIDGVEVKGKPGQTILDAADDANIYIPRLCAHKELVPFGGCRVCTVMVNGRAQSACTQPISEGAVVENEVEEVQNIRKDIIDMLFVEGNHYCMFCEKSGNCELQALAYRFGIMAPKYPYIFPKKELDASHSDLLIDRNRCILCGRCGRASRDLDKKNVFGFLNRGLEKKVGVDSDSKLAGTDVALADRSFDVCPVGTLIRKRKGYEVPIGERLYDNKPIGSNIDN